MTTKTLDSCGISLLVLSVCLTAINRKFPERGVHVPYLASDVSGFSVKALQIWRSEDVYCLLRDMSVILRPSQFWSKQWLSASSSESITQLQDDTWEMSDAFMISGSSWHVFPSLSALFQSRSAARSLTLVCFKLICSVFSWTWYDNLKQLDISGYESDLLFEIISYELVWFYHSKVVQSDTMQTEPPPQQKYDFFIFWSK